MKTILKALVFHLLPGCTNPNFVEYYDFEYNDTLKYQLSGPVDTANQDNGSCVNEIILGCTNPNFIEYLDTANVYNEGDCMTPNESLVVQTKIIWSIILTLILEIRMLSVQLLKLRIV